MLLKLLKKFESLFDGKMGDWKNELVDILEDTVRLVRRKSMPRNLQNRHHSIHVPDHIFANGEANSPGNIAHMGEEM